MEMQTQVVIRTSVGKLKIEMLAGFINICLQYRRRSFSFS